MIAEAAAQLGATPTRGEWGRSRWHQMDIFLRCLSPALIDLRFGGPFALSPPQSHRGGTQMGSPIERGFVASVVPLGAREKKERTICACPAGVRCGSS